MGHANVSFNNISWGRLYCIVFGFWVMSSVVGKRNKKYNPLKQLDLVAKQALKNAAVGYVTGGEGCKLVDLRSGQPSNASYTTVRLISTLRHEWSVLIAVFGIDSSGQKYMKSEEITVTRPCFQSELIDTLNEKHAALGKNFNQAHLINYGWIGTTYVKNWDEAEAFDLLTNLGAFEYKLEQGE